MHATDTAGGAKHALQRRLVLSVFTPTHLTAGQLSSRIPASEAEPHEQK